MGVGRRGVGRVVATSIVYMRRVYLRHSFVAFPPWIVAPTCLYVAAKSEECCVGVKFIAVYSKKMEEAKKGGLAGMGNVSEAEILEMEMKLLEALDYYLLVFHPYMPAMNYLADADLSPELTQTCWSLLNDSYRTDLCLVHAPHMIALGCIYLAAQLADKDNEIRTWFEDMRGDMNEIRIITMDLLDFYDKYRAVPELTVRCGLGKIRTGWVQHKAARPPLWEQQGG